MLLLNIIIIKGIINIITNKLIFSAASSPLRFMMFGVEISIALQLQNRNVTPYIGRL